MPRLPVSASSATTVTLDGRRVVSFGGCNYLGLAHHPDVIAAAIAGISDFGLSTSASRETTGNTTAHDELERDLAAFVGLAAAVVVPDGYSANLAAAQALAPEHPIALIDRRAHRSIRDAAACAGMRVIEFEHRDADSAARVLADLDPATAAAIFTDGVFATDGGVAPLRALLAAMRPSADTLVVDDCHGLGVLGPGGRGTLASLGVRDDRIVLTSTLAKGIGCHGGMVGGTRSLVDAVRSRASAYVCTTPASPALACAARASIRVLRAEPERVERLHANAERLSAVIRHAGLQASEFATPIRAFVVADAFGRPDAAAMRATHAFLLEQGFLAPLITYPGGPWPLYFRLSVTSEHRPEQIEALGEALADAMARRPAVVARTPDAPARLTA
ncbi:MAG: aminotransferase class I/II-fold pyridoxal phosphate-dependent enzyme [Phycisphaerales bacterium]